MDKSLSPTPEQIRQARERAGLTQQQAAELIYRTHLQRWSEFERGEYAMSPSDWELFLVKTNQHPSYWLRSAPIAEREP